MPDQPLDAAWPFPHRLPLGAGWSGACTAPGHDGLRPTQEELKSACNLGYAKSCPRLPAERHADAVRFSLGEERDGILLVRYCCEREHLPASHGDVLFTIATQTSPQPHPDARLQRMAECYVQAQLARRAPQPTSDITSNTEATAPVTADTTLVPNSP